MRAVRRFAALAALAALAGACKGDTTNPNSTSIALVVSSVRVDGGPSGTLVSGALPNEASGPFLTLSAPAAVINGGTSGVGLTGSADFQTIIVAVQGLNDFYEITLPAAATSAALLVTVAQNVSLGTFQLAFAVGGSRPTIGPYATQSLSLISVGTGDVQVSVSWNSTADVDLHVVEPGGEEVYYGNDISAAGGELDLDSNAACGSDGPRNENIVWPTGSAPTGEYIVRVDYWSACSATRTDYVVTVQVLGQQPQIFSGFFTGDGDGGSAGSGVEITRFTR
jgi:hypothetical protein